MINFLLLLLLSFSISEFENSFLNKDLENLQNYFARDKKVYMEFTFPVKVYGFFSKSQILALFREIFKRFENEEFKVVEKMEGANSLILKVEWKTQDKLTNEVKNTIIFMRLNFEDDKWYIAEIKGT